MIYDNKKGGVKKDKGIKIEHGLLLEGLGTNTAHAYL